MRMNEQNEQKIVQLNQITVNKKQLATELRQIIDTVKQLDYDNKEVQNALVSRENAIEEKMKDITGGGQVNSIKQAVFKLKVRKRTALAKLTNHNSVIDVN